VHEANAPRCGTCKHWEALVPADRAKDVQRRCRCPLPCKALATPTHLNLMHADDRAPCLCWSPAPCES